MIVPVRRPVLLLDVDGVLADFVSWFVALGNECYGRRDDASQITDGYRIGEQLGVAGYDADVRAAAEEEDHGDMGVLPGVEEVWDRLDQEAVVYFVTTPMWTSCSWFRERLVWLERHFPLSGAKVHDRVVYTTDKWLVRGDVFADDRADHVNAWQAVNPGGVAILAPAPNRWKEEAPAFWQRVLEVVRRT